MKKNLAAFLDKISPIKKLLQEVGGDLHAWCIDEKFTITISCPEQDLPPYDPDEIINENDISINCIGTAPILSPVRLTKFVFLRDYDKENPESTITLNILADCFNVEVSRAAICSALELAINIDNNNSIEEISIYPDVNFGIAAYFTFKSKYINSTEKSENSQASLLLNAAALDDDNIKLLTGIIQLTDCEKIWMTGDNEDIKMQLVKIMLALTKASEVHTGPYSIKYYFPDAEEENETENNIENEPTEEVEEEDLESEDNSEYGEAIATATDDEEDEEDEIHIPQLEIRDRSGDLVIMAKYIENSDRTATLTGRFHRPELTHKVAKILDKIFNEKTQLDIEDRAFTRSLEKKLEKHKVLLTDGFREFMYQLSTAEDCHDIQIFQNTLRNFLFNGMMSIDERGNFRKTLTLDAPDDYLEGHDKFYDGREIC